MGQGSQKEMIFPTGQVKNINNNQVSLGSQNKDEVFKPMEKRTIMH